LHRTYVTNVERGACNLSLESIAKLAKALGTSMSSLFVDVEVSATRLLNGRTVEFGAAKAPVEILLAEDDPGDAELAIRSLRKAGLSNRIQTVYDGAEALDFVFGTGTYEGRDAHNQPSLIMLDLQLPKVGGFEVLRRLKNDSRTSGIPVVALTMSQQDVVECARLGAKTCLTKPINFERLNHVIPKLHFRWLLLKQHIMEAA
jgi:two-component system, response regulator